MTQSAEMTSGELHTVQVDFEGLMEVLGKNLYSTPLVAVRELVQNAHDSCQRRILEDANLAKYSPLIRLIIRQGTLTIEDNGAGLTRQEILDYLATIGAGYTRRLRAEHGDDGLIGAFGLGFLSAYVISDRVEVRTTSYKEPQARWRFTSRTGERFSIEPEPAHERGVGTQVTLTLREPEPLKFIMEPTLVGGIGRGRSEYPGCDWGMIGVMGGKEEM